MANNAGVPMYEDHFYDYKDIDSDNLSPSYENNGGFPDLETITSKFKENEEDIEDRNRRNFDNPRNSQMPVILSIEDKIEIDKRSVYVANVDYETTEEELRMHFDDCGFINRVTFLRNKFTGHPKGCAYIEFTDEECVFMALSRNESIFRGRQIKVSHKRTNLPGMSNVTNRAPRGATALGGYYRGPYGAVRATTCGQYFTLYPQNVEDLNS